MTTLASTDQSLSRHQVRNLRPGLSHELRCGVSAGMVGGLAMAVALMVLCSTFLDESPFYPLQVIAAAITGSAALGPVSIRVVFIGALVHLLGPALFWGAAFGLVVWVVHPERGMTLAWFGLLVGATAQLVDVHLLIPALSHSWATTLTPAIPLHLDLWSEHVPVAVSWIAHLAFGFALSLYPWKYDPMAKTFD